jgi:hypothetical protein
VIEERHLPLLEALADVRIGQVPIGEVPAEMAAFIEREGEVARLAEDRRGEVLESIAEAVRTRRVEWGTQSPGQGEVLDALAVHCRDELDEVELLSAEPMRLRLGWRRERALVELRAGTVAVDRLPREELLLLPCPVSDSAVARLAEDQRLAARGVLSLGMG